MLRPNEVSGFTAHCIREEVASLSVAAGTLRCKRASNTITLGSLEMELYCKPTGVYEAYDGWDDNITDLVIDLCRPHKPREVTP